jgi:hypothetical protein
MGLDEGVKRLTKIERDTVFLLVLFTILCALITRSWISSMSLTLGGALMLLNFHFLWRFSSRVLEKETRNKKGFVVGLFFMFFLFLGSVACALVYFKAPIVPFFVGTLSLIGAIFLQGIFLL